MRTVGLGVLFLSMACSAGFEPLGSSTEDLTVGSVNLKRCKGQTYYCGTMTRPLDPAGQVTGTINVHYEWYAHTNAGPAVGTIVAIEGGPGYGSCESRDYFTTSFDLTNRDMLLVDARGTGQSVPINCSAAQTDSVLTQADVAACGTTLGTKSDLYGSDLAADDMAAILSALGVTTVDLYGDSYGTYSSQIFAGRHPTLIRTIVLDGAYPALNADPFFVDEGPGMTTSFDNTCSRSPDCPSGTTTSRVASVVAALRANPSSAPNVVRGGVSGPLTPTDLAFLMNVAGEQYNLYSEYDPALRAYLAGDTLPLVRLVNEVWANEEGGVGSTPAEFSIGMLIATTCQDGPMAYDMTLAPGPQRNATWNTAVANIKNTKPNAWAPFSVDEWLATPTDWSITPLCLAWPVSQSAHPEGHPIPSGKMPDVPTLVLTGDLDTVTPVLEGNETAAEFNHVTRVIGVNGVHVTALGDPSLCFSGIVQDFVNSGGTASTSCAATALDAMRVLPSYALNAADLSLRGVAGNTTDANKRIAYAAVLTANDAYLRMYTFSETSGTGLRGGTFKSNKALTGVTLTKAKFTSDLAVSGSVTADANNIISGSLSLVTGATGSLAVSWAPTGPQGNATITGTINGSSVSITVPAPGGAPY